jgi:DNA-binding response OmpR family regulator
VEGHAQRILVVEDDDLVRRAVRLTCESEGYQVGELDRGEQALERAEAFRPDLILLDLMLPDTSGFDICRELRRQGHSMPIIILSAKNEEIDVVLGLEIGADDYIMKPFRPRELLARIAAHLRKFRERSLEPAADGVVRLAFRGLVIDMQERRVIRSAGDISLTHTEFDLLAYLAQNAGQALSRDKILTSVWGYDHPMETRVIDVHIRNLRRKIEDDPSNPRFILAVPGIGYRFAALKSADAG